jgi:hypothetical protein
MVPSGFREEGHFLRDVLRYAVIMFGGQFVTGFGIELMLVWCADNLESPRHV